MLCPDSAEGEVELKKDSVEEKPKEPEKTKSKKGKKVPSEGSGSVELNSFKNPKTWKKSISNFFRNQLRSTRSNEGDRPSGSKEKFEEFEEKEITPDQKWQSLGKMFRRQSLAENLNKSNPGESSSPNKRLAVKKVISSYFGNKNQ